MNLLFEIGLEELPAIYIKSAINDLEKLFSMELKNNRINFEKIKKFSTPRRLALIVENIDSIQKDLNEIKLGPSYNICYDNGKETEVLRKFIISQNSTLNDIIEIENEKGKYVAIKKYEKGKNIIDILPNIFDTVLRKISFEKTMKWSDKSFRFLRPIKWIVSMLDSEIVNFEFEGIKSSNITRGMRIIGSQNIAIDNILKYQDILKENFVIVDREDRKNAIIKSINENCDNEEEKTIIKDFLLEEIVDLVEYPYAIKGKFDEKFLELPEEIITITMETHQRYFPVRTIDGKLSNSFVLIRNGNEFSEIVKKGNEKVIIPRLKDAEFFFNEDLKKPLIDNVDKIKKVIFQKDMGTIYDKIERMHLIADYLIEKLNLKEFSENIHTTITLSKLDLVSNVISEKEFTKLQGYMGSIYALKQGYNENISKGIKEHYLPLNNNDNIETIEGKITSLSDKLDTFVGCFLVDIIPTSSKDPYAIRRACMGIVTILKDIKANIDYIDLINNVVLIFRNSKKILNEKNIDKIINLFEDRLINNFDRESKDNNIRLFIKNDKNILSLIEKNNTYFDLSEVESIIKRVKNIILKNNIIEINCNLFENLYENNLYNFILELEKISNFNEFIKKLVDNKHYISEYFDNIKINTNDEDIKNNRINLLTRLYLIVSKYIIID